MHTRCTHCDTAFRITPEVLTYARGRVRCGQCLRTFDALEHLSEEAGAVLIPVTPEAQADNPDAEQATPDFPGGEADIFTSEPASPDSEFGTPEAFAHDVDQGTPEDGQDTLIPEPTDAAAEYDISELDEQARAIPDREEDMLDAKAASPDTEGDELQAEAAAHDVDLGTREDEQDSPIPEPGVASAEYDTSALDEQARAIPDGEEDMLNAEAASADTDDDAAKAEAATLDVDQDTPTDWEGNTETQQDSFGSKNTFEGWEVPLADEDDTLDGDLDLDATNSWKLDEELLNTSTLPALPGLVEHPEYAESQEPLPDPVVTAKPRPEMNWDDSWDDMSFDDEHGIPLMEDLEEVAETDDQSAVTKNPFAERIWFDPATTLTEADLLRPGKAFMKDGQAGPEPVESTQAHLTEATQGPTENDVAGLAGPAGNNRSHLAEDTQDPTENDVAELAEPAENAQAYHAEATRDPTDSVVAGLPELVESTQAPLLEATQDPTDNDVAELVEAIENATNMVEETGGALFAGKLEIPAGANPEHIESASVDLADRSPGDTAKPAPETDIAEVQAELERLAQLVGMEPGEIPEDASKPRAAENFDQIVRKRRSSRSMALTGLFSLLLAMLLGAQLVHYNRAGLLADSSWGPLLRQTYARLGIDLPPDWELDRYDIRQLGGVQDPTSPGVLVISISVRNQAKRAQPYPVIRLVLEDRWGDRLAMRDLKPADYLDSEPAQGAMMLSGQLIKADISIVEPEGAGATTFQVDACIENPRGHLDCANQL